MTDVRLVTLDPGHFHAALIQKEMYPGVVPTAHVYAPLGPDLLAHLGRIAGFNGRAATMGFCYGGPYAILGPKRLGYDAGISCHGSQMLDYIKELDGVTEPVCIIWGDQDHRAPPEVLEAYRAVPARMKNVEVHIFPGIQHGYMMPGSPKAFDQKTREFSMKRAVAILDGGKADSLPALLDEGKHPLYVVPRIDNKTPALTAKPPSVSHARRVCCA